MSAPLYMGADQVRQVLTWPLLNEAVEEALKAVGNDGPNPDDANDSYAHQPARISTKAGSDASSLLFAMPGFVGNYHLTERNGASTNKIFNTLACKLVTSFPKNILRQPSLPNILANILLFSSETGQLECIMDGTQITAWRTAAASIVATKYLYFHRFKIDTQILSVRIKVAIIGCGVQGRSHAIGMCATFNVTDVYLWNRTAENAQALADDLTAINAKAGRPTQVYVVATPGAAVAYADVICVGTYSPTALIDASMLQKRTIHINTVGAGQVHFGEVAQDIYDRSTVYVDSWSSARSELKGLKANIVSEVGEVIRTGKYPPLEGITIFQSMGMAAEDATVAQAVYEAYKREE